MSKKEKTAIRSTFRTKMTAALNESIKILCFHEEKIFSQILTKGLFPVADAMNINSIVIYHQIKIDEEKHYKQMYRWDRDEGGITNRSLIHLPNNKAVTGWIKILEQNIFINRRISEMSEDEAAFLNPFGVKSILMIPVFAHGEFWGCVFFQDHKKERRFDENSIDLIQSAAYICAKTITL